MLVVAFALLVVAIGWKLLSKDLISELEKGKRPEGAEKELLRIVKEQSDNVRAEGWLLRLYLENRKMKEADQILSSLLVKAPDTYLTRRGACKYNLIKRREQALTHCKKALALSERSATDLNNLAAARLYSGQYVKATELLKEALEKDPANVKVNNNLGYAYYRRKLYKQAKKYLQRALELDPEFISARQNLVRVYHQTSEIDKCIKELKRILESKPDDQEAMLLLAGLYFGFKEDIEKAKDYARKAIEIKDTRRARKVLEEIEKYETIKKSPGNKTGIDPPSPDF